MKAAAAFFSGLLFSVGLIISGMTQPANIVGFLDFFGEWKPALAFVMAGAVLVYAVLFPLVSRRKKPLFEKSFDLPKSAGIDARLLMGSVFFGLGWGLGGLCPGPSVVALGAGAGTAALFVIAMASGMGTARLLESGSGSSARTDDAACG